MEEYYIEAGVHRAVAAREAGLEEVRAILHREGIVDEEIVVRLDQLFANRETVVGVKTKRRDLPGLIQAMLDPVARGNIPPIELQIRGVFAQPNKLFALHDVVIVFEEEDES